MPYLHFETAELLKFLHKALRHLYAVANLRLEPMVTELDFDTIVTPLTLRLVMLMILKSWSETDRALSKTSYNLGLDSYITYL